MWEPFTEHARHSVAQAHDEAQAMGHPHLGTEHLLLALLAHGPVETMDIDLDRVRREVRLLRLRQEVAGTSGEVAFTENARKAIELAFEEARELQHNFIARDHLLLGILRLSESTARRALTGAGVDAGALRTAVRDRAAEAARPPETMHLQAQAARAHAARGEVLPSTRPPEATGLAGHEALDMLRCLREEVAAMRTELAALREFLAATPPPPE